MQQDSRTLTSPEKFQIARLRVIKGMKDGGFLSEEDYNKERMKIIDNMVGLSPRKQSSNPNTPIKPNTILSPPSTPRLPETPLSNSTPPATPRSIRKYDEKQSDPITLNTSSEDVERMRDQFRDFKIMIMAKLQILEEGYLLHFRSVKTLLPSSEQVSDLSKRIDQIIQQFSEKVATLSSELREIRSDLEKRNQSDYDNKLLEIEEEVANIALQTHDRIEDMDHKVAEIENSNVDIYKKLGETVTLFTNQNELSMKKVGETEKKILEEFENFIQQAKINKDKDFVALESKIKISLSKMKENLESSQEEALSNMDSELFVIKQRMGVEEIDDSDKDPVQILNSIKLGVVEQMKTFESKLQEISKPPSVDYESLIPTLLSRIESLEGKVKLLEKQ